MRRLLALPVVLTVLVQHGCWRIVTALSSISQKDAFQLLPNVTDAADCLRGAALHEKASAAGVTPEELTAVEEIACVPGDLIGVSLHLSQQEDNDGIPEGVQCVHTRWCDSEGLCSEICEHGTVQISPWYLWAAAWQRRATEHLPLCYSTLFATHNSAITIADGFGNQDKYWASYFKYIPSMQEDVLRTNNQWLSMTDQLNLGIRLVEIDVHWFEGKLRVAHCGGLHSPMLNTVIRALNALSKLAGTRIRWDTETMGCSPSLSSVPVKDQRPLVEALAEVRRWLDANPDELIIVYFDDEKDLQTWGKVAVLEAQLLAAIPRDWILAPGEKERLFPGVWPSVRQLRALNKRCIVVSRNKYRQASDVVFMIQRTICGWWEAPVHTLSRPPSCHCFRTSHDAMDGTLSRINDCKLSYGPLNCDFKPHSEQERLDVLTDDVIAELARCSWNSISPDLLTPGAAENTIWSWAESEPKSKFAPGGGYIETVGESEAPMCVAMWGATGRWHSVACDGSRPAACRADSVAVPGVMASKWVLGASVQPNATHSAGQGTGNDGCGGCCPDGYTFGTPVSGRDNFALWEVLQVDAVSEVQLALHGPGFMLPSMDVVAS